MWTDCSNYDADCHRSAPFFPREAPNRLTAIGRAAHPIPNCASNCASLSMPAGASAIVRPAALPSLTSGCASSAHYSHQERYCQSDQLPFNRWAAFTRFLDDGRVWLTNNAAERALRGVAIRRKNWTFAGSDTGRDRAASVYTLIETCKMNDVDLQAWLADVLARLPANGRRFRILNIADEVIRDAWRRSPAPRPGGGVWRELTALIARRSKLGMIVSHDSTQFTSNKHR
jgi:Transposase IS66 family/IS66 C-terminal element